jgi:tRNA(fMet)-specific endonuclease VapC
MLDTNILIAMLRGKARAAEGHLGDHEGLLCASAVTAMEIEAGLALGGSNRQREAYLALLAFVVILPYDEPAAVRTAQLRVDLRKQGLEIGAYDALIAGHALSRGCTLVTNNVREFDRVPGLVVEDWLA